MSAPRLREREQGMILINVLMFVAIASGVVLLMIAREELALDRAFRIANAARAQAATRGGELSAIVALRRDSVDGPEADDATEPWAAVAETGAPIRGGSFDLAIADAQGRFNVNLLRSGDSEPVVLFLKIGAAAGLTPEQGVQAIELVRLTGPLNDLRPLRVSGLPPEVVAKLLTMVTALPGNTVINLNAASPELMAVLIEDPAIVAQLVGRRTANKRLTPADLTELGIATPRLSGFRSDRFWVRTRVTLGETAQESASLILRRPGVEGVPDAVAVARWRGLAIPDDAPGFATQ